MTKGKNKGEIKPWLSANCDCRERRFIQVGNSLMLSKEYARLSIGARFLHLCMSMEAGGKRDFQFPQRAFKKYGIATSSARRYIKELEKQGFITCSSGKCVRQPNNYSFSFMWKSSPNANPLFHYDTRRSPI